jgi:ParB-like chromosome segregation protein Spo0J
MTRKSRAFGLSIKTRGERKRKKVRKNNGWARKSQSRLKEPEANETSERTPFRQPPYAVQDIEIADITVGGGRRALKEATVKELMESISRLGLREPTTVRPGVWGKYVLVDGLHRLEAMKRLGKSTVPCFVMPDDKRAAEMMEISTNLHRADLTPLERAKFAAKWLKLTKEFAKAGHSAHPGGDQPHDKGVSKTAKKLGVSPKTLRRLEALDRMSPVAKAAAKAAGLDKNRKQDALLEVAKQNTPEAQVAKVNEIAARHKRGAKKQRGAASADDKKDLHDLIEAWNRTELKYSFCEASDKVSERFITHIRKDRSRRGDEE